MNIYLYVAFNLDRKITLSSEILFLIPKNSKVNITSDSNDMAVAIEKYVSIKCNSHQA